MADLREHVEQRLAKLKERRDFIRENPLRWASQRIQQIDRALKGRPGGPGKIEPRQSAPGNVSMYDHLQRLRAGYEEERKAGGRVDRDLGQLDGEIARLEGELSNGS